MSTGYNDADSIKTEASSQKDKFLKINIGVFFDGTNNNMQTSLSKKYEERGKITPESEVKEEDLKANTGYSNIAELDALFQTGLRDNQQYIKFYERGAGANNFQYVPNWATSLKGLGFGLKNDGVVELVSETITNIHHRLSVFKNPDEVELHFYVYGFSRGATCARLFTHLLLRDKGSQLPNNREKEFKSYLADNLYKNDRVTFLESFQNKSVDFLGIYDTVASIGYFADEKDNTNILYYSSAIEKEFRKNYHKKNVNEYGLYISPSVKKVFHIGALDEFRMNFAFTDVGKEVPSNCIELLVPGCHSDIGGGYITGIESVNISPKNTTLFTKEPAYDDNGVSALSKDILGQLGWLDFNGRYSDLYCSIEKNKCEWYQDSLLEWTKKWKKLPTDPNQAPQLSEITKPLSSSSPLISSLNLSFPNIDGHITFKRMSWGGYSNIMLALMLDMTLKHCPSVSVFNEKPFARFEIPNDLQKFYKGIKSQSLVEGNRIFVCAGDSYSSDQYRALRIKYLHFTSTDRILKKLVNTPFRVKQESGSDAICRIVYHGDKEDQDLHFMYDYHKKSTHINIW